MTEKAGPCPDKRPHIPHYQSHTSLSTAHNTESWCHREGTITVSDVIDLFARTNLVGERHVHTREDTEIYLIQTQNKANWNDWQNEVTKKCTIKDIQTTTRVWLSLLACVYPHTTISNQHFTCFTPFHLYVETLHTAGRPGLVIGHWSLVVVMSHCYRDFELHQSLGRNWSLCFKLLQA